MLSTRASARRLAAVSGAALAMSLAPFRGSQGLASPIMFTDTLRTDTLQAAPLPHSPDTTEMYRRVTLREYAGRVAGPRGVLRVLLVSGFEQARGQPKERAKTWRGYEDRLATRAAQHAIAETIILGFSAARDERPARFALCGCVGRGARLTHALLAPLRVDTPHGTRLSALTPVSEATSALLVTTVNPRGFSFGDGLRAGATGLVASSLLASLREFWPWRWRPPGI